MADTYFVIEVKGRFRQLLKATVKASGGVNIVVKRHNRINPLSRPIYRHELASAPITEITRYSIHPSPNILDANMIHFTHLNSLEEVSLMLATQTVKRTGLMVPIAGVGPGNLDSTDFDMPEKAVSEVSIGSIDTLSAQLRYLIVVSAPDREYISPPKTSYIRFSSVILGLFRISILWSTWKRPSNSNGFHQTLATERGMDLSGVDDQQLAAVFNLFYLNANRALLPYLR